MNRRAEFWSIAILIALALSGCAPENGADSSFAAAPASAQPTPEAGKRVAITHGFTLRLPSDQVEAVQQSHLAECAKFACTVLSTRLDRSDEGFIYASSSVRIAPDAYSTFASVLAAPPAKIVVHTESAEDKTLAVLDVSKRLDVKMALRDRLIEMLNDPGPKSAADLAAVEKELAQVQGDIETIVAQRDYLLAITETVKVDVTYRGTTAEAAGLDLSPIDRAIAHVGQTVIQSVAALVSFLAALIPWIPLLTLTVWIVRRGLRRWRARKAVG